MTISIHKDLLGLDRHGDKEGVNFLGDVHGGVGCSYVVVLFGVGRGGLKEMVDEIG